MVVEEYFAWLSREMAQTTANREATMVKAAYRYAKRLGMVGESPAEHVRAPAVDEVEPEVYSNDELRRIRAAIRDDLDDVIFYGLAYEGLRRFELVNLTWKKETDSANYVDLEKSADAQSEHLTTFRGGSRISRACLFEPREPSSLAFWAARIVSTNPVTARVSTGRCAPRHSGLERLVLF